MGFINNIYDFNDFKVHELKGYIQNTHIIDYNEELFLIDSGCINDVKRIEKYCNEILDRPVSDIKIMVLTHMHPDHAGGANKLRAQYNIPIAAFKEIDEWYKGLGGIIQHKIDCYLATSVAHKSNRKLEHILYSRKVKPDYLLVDNDKLPFFPEWQVLHVPGHTMHDLAIYNQKEKVVFIADLICEVKGRHCLPVPVLFPDKMADSFNRLTNIDAKTIFRSHGGILEAVNPKHIFNHMENLIYQPLNPMIEKAYRISKFPPAVRHNAK
ncbi:MAG: MBL fold metallo-hydrolase [Syntrophomonadaceae bacterium]|nr:MBL fold metallo-hydrolase [Syntrophomonadaceae bacterium]